MSKRSIFVGPNGKRVFLCNCGSHTIVDNETKCKDCGAKYRVDVQQTVSSIE